MAQSYTSPDGVVEAEQLTKGNIEYVAAWCAGRVVEETDALDDTKKYAALNLMTEYGPARAHENDYVVKLPAGNFRVISSYMFLKRHTPL